MHTLNITKLWKEKTHESTSFANFGGSGGSLFRTSLTTLKKSKQVPRFELDPDKTSIWLDEQKYCSKSASKILWEGHSLF